MTNAEISVGLSSHVAGASNETGGKFRDSEQFLKCSAKFGDSEQVLALQKLLTVPEFPKGVWPAKCTSSGGLLLRRCAIVAGVNRKRIRAIIEELYDALLEAGASEDKARAAALASYENRFSQVESSLVLLKWMGGFNLALTVAVLFRVFS